MITSEKKTTRKKQTKHTRKCTCSEFYFPMERRYNGRLWRHLQYINSYKYKSNIKKEIAARGRRYTHVKRQKVREDRYSSSSAKKKKIKMRTRRKSLRTVDLSIFFESSWLWHLSEDQILNVKLFSFPPPPPPFALTRQRWKSSAVKNKKMADDDSFSDFFSFLFETGFWEMEQVHMGIPAKKPAASGSASRVRVCLMLFPQRCLYGLLGCCKTW